MIRTGRGTSKQIGNIVNLKTNIYHGWDIFLISEVDLRTNLYNAIGLEGFFIGGSVS